MRTPLDLWRKLNGPEDPPARLGRHSGALLILGGGAGVWDDYASVRPWGGEIMAVNDIGAFCHDRVTHWVTLHPEFMAGWLEYRRRHCYGEGSKPFVHTFRAHATADAVWPLEAAAGGTSGLFAAFVGLLLGYERIVLAGIPMDGGPHFFDPPWQVTETAARHIVLQWDQARDDFFEGRVKSLSGRTREWLGAP
jgi:hypothetical protein